MAARAAQPAGERADRHPRPGPRVLAVPGVPRRGPQGPDLRTKGPAYLLEQPGLLDRFGPLQTPGVDAADDDAHRRPSHLRSPAAGGDQVTGQAPAAAGGRPLLARDLG